MLGIWKDEAPNLKGIAEERRLLLKADLAILHLVQVCTSPKCPILKSRRLFGLGTECFRGR